MKRLLIASLLFLPLTSCKLVDDQTDLPAERYTLVNPAPVKFDEQAQQKHRVIMAVIDSGVDYNHPLLAAHMHYTFGADGQPDSAGWDYLGNDPWAYPLIARSADLEESDNEDERLVSTVVRDRIRKGLQERPSLAKWISPFRLLENEDKVYHGTHVAGLMVYDRADFGLRAYRVLPLSTTMKKSPLGKLRTSERFIEALSQSIEKAHADGARIANLSLAWDLSDKCLQAEGLESSGCPASDRQELQRLQQAIANAKDMILVIAAGNDGKEFEGLAKLPCGIDAENVVCVGAMKSRKTRADFSNTPLTHRNLFWAPGVDILSLSPMELCPEASFYFLTRSAKYYDDSTGRMMWQQAWDRVAQSCRKSPGFKIASGTSMASPLLARALAKILAENPQYTPAQAIAALKKNSLPVTVDKRNFQRIEVDRPSWLKKGSEYYQPAANIQDGFEFFFTPTQDI